MKDTIDRPGIVWLKETNGGLKSYLLASISERGLNLVGYSDSQTLSIEAFLQDWSGVFMFLWRAPAELDSLRLGDTNAAALKGGFKTACSRLIVTISKLLQLVVTMRRFRRRY